MAPYYMVLWRWGKLHSEAWWLRGPSVLSSVTAIWALWTLVRRRCGTTIAAGAVIVFATNPFVLSWSLQARGYTLVMAATAWALVNADSLVRTTRRSSAVALGILGGFASATSLSSVFLIAGIFVAVLVLRPSKVMVRELSFSVMCGSLTFAPFAYAFANDRSWTEWIPKLDGRLFSFQMQQFFGGKPTLVLYGVSIIGCVLGSIRRRSARPFLVPLFLVATTVVSLVVVSLFIQPLFISRYLAAASPLLAIGVMGGCAALPEKVRDASVAGFSVACITMTAVWPSHVLPWNEDYRWATRTIEANARPGDGIMAAPLWTFVAIDQNWDGPPPDVVYVRVTNVEGNLVLEESPERAAFPVRVWVVARGYRGLLRPDDSDLGRILRAYPNVLGERQRG